MKTNLSLLATLCFALTSLSTSTPAVAAPMDCYNDPRVADFVSLARIRLCRKSEGVAAVDCVLDKRIADWQRSDQIHLCAGAQAGSSPVDCYFSNKDPELKGFALVTLCTQAD